VSAGEKHLNLTPVGTLDFCSMCAGKRVSGISVKLDGAKNSYGFCARCIRALYDGLPAAEAVRDGGGSA